ncbi:MAG: hypothetical protein U0905_19640 [Pirellulales bacterium]
MNGHWKTKLLLGTWIAFGILVLVIRNPISGQDPGSISKSKLASLLEERRATLKTRVEMIEKLVGVTRSTQEALIAAREDLINAEIEMATNGNERMAAWQRKIENARQLETVMEQRKHEGRGTEADVLMAKAARLAAEIELQRESDLRVKPD